MKGIVFAAAAIVAAAGSANADWTLQFDVNDIAIQAKDSQGNDSAFGGVNHVGSLELDDSVGVTLLNQVAIQFGGGGFVDQNFGAGWALSDFDAEIELDSSVVKGGHIFMEVSDGVNFDTYSAQIVTDSGDVDTDAQGRFVIDGLTFQGTFSDAFFGNVDVTEWFNGQGGDRLFGDFLQFKFDPNASGFGFADMDLFVVVPLPPAAYAGLATMAGLAGVGYIRRRK